MTTRTLLNRATNRLVAYPRQDDEPVIGLDRDAYHVLQIIRDPQPEPQDGCQVVPLPVAIEISHPDGDDLNGTATYGWQQQPIPPAPPRPDWLTFKAAVLRSATVNQALAAAYQVAPVAAAALAPSLTLAERGSPDEFAVVWGAIIQATAVPAPELVGLAALAEACNLPQAFVEAVNPPAGMQRARDESGRFIADDPATPDVNEAWVPAE